MNVSHEYLLKSRQVTWENAEVIDNYFGPLAMEVKNENGKRKYQALSKNASKEGCTNESFPAQRVCQRGYDKTKKKLCVDLEHKKVISVRVLIAPVDLNVNVKPSSRSQSISFSEGDSPTAATPSESCSVKGGKKIECTICHRKFTRKCDLTRHCCNLSCPQCGKKFAKNSNLKRHLVIHSGVKEFSCDICHKAFTEKGTLTAHRRTHTGDKPFECGVCNAMFSRRSDLSRHMRTHTGQTPYQCEICEKKFTYLTTLKIHRSIHSEEKPFACTYANCQKTYKNKGNLRSHVRVHTKGKP